MSTERERQEWARKAAELDKLDTPDLRDTWNKMAQEMFPTTPLAELSRGQREVIHHELVRSGIGKLYFSDNIPRSVLEELMRRMRIN